MANGNPQREEGYTAIANEIVERLAHIDLSPYETRILMALLRKTYGWKKKYDQISLTQFEKATGMDRKSVARTLKRLETRNLIEVFREGNRKTNSYGFNKKWKDWDVDKSEDKLNTDSGSRATTHSGNGATTGVVAPEPHTKETLKENITKESDDFKKFIHNDDVTNDDRIRVAKENLINNMAIK